MKNNYIGNVLNLISNRSAHPAIKAELENHIANRTDYYIDIGYDEAEAESLAIRDMGSAEETAAPLNALHKTKWYEQALNVFAVLFSVGVFVLFLPQLPFYNKFLYSVDTLTYHSIEKELISLAITATIVFLLFYSRRKRSVFIPAVLLIMLCFIAIYDLIFSVQYRVFTAIFQPAFYALLMTIMFGIKSYSNVTLIQNLISSNLGNAIGIISLIFYIILIIATVFILCVTVQEQEMKPSKKLKLPCRIIVYSFSIFVSVNIFLTAVGIATGAINYENRLAELAQERKQMIDFCTDVTMQKYIPSIKPIMPNTNAEIVTESGDPEEGTLSKCTDCFNADSNNIMTGFFDGETTVYCFNIWEEEDKFGRTHQNTVSEEQIKELCDSEPKTDTFGIASWYLTAKTTITELRKTDWYTNAKYVNIFGIDCIDEETGQAISEGISFHYEADEEGYAYELGFIYEPSSNEFVLNYLQRVHTGVGPISERKN